MFCYVLGGPGEFTKLREACRNNFHLFSAKWQNPYETIDWGNYSKEIRRPGGGSGGPSGGSGGPGGGSGGPGGGFGGPGGDFDSRSRGLATTSITLKS